MTITGRIKDLIIRGGENIHPLEIENCILTHAGVMDVSVVGVPDEKYGEVVAAFIIPEEHQDEAAPLTEENIREWVRGRLSNHLGKTSFQQIAIIYEQEHIELMSLRYSPEVRFQFGTHDHLPQNCQRKDTEV